MDGEDTARPVFARFHAVMEKHFSIKVRGVVQGVYFRVSAKKKADDLGIKGMVRNEADGSVYIEAEGAMEDIKQFIHWCHQGPPRARVDECEVKEGIVKNFKGFLIEE